jgi:hypothetical protein
VNEANKANEANEANEANKTNKSNDANDANEESFFVDFSIFCATIARASCERCAAIARSVARTQYCHFDDISSRMTNIIENRKYPLRFYSKDV